MLAVANVMLAEQTLTASDQGLCVALVFERRVLGGIVLYSYSRAAVTAEWLTTLMATVGLLTMPGKVGCRLRLDGGSIVGIGHLKDDVWFDPRPESERRLPTATERKRRQVAAALAHINTERARAAQRELDPTVSGWTDDDVLAEARRLGWK